MLLDFTKPSVEILYSVAPELLVIHAHDIRYSSEGVSLDIEAQLIATHVTNRVQGVLQSGHAIPPDETEDGTGHGQLFEWSLGPLLDPDANEAYFCVWSAFPDETTVEAADSPDIAIMMGAPQSFVLRRGSTSIDVFNEGSSGWWVELTYNPSFDDSLRLGERTFRFPLPTFNPTSKELGPLALRNAGPEPLRKSSWAHLTENNL